MSSFVWDGANKPEVYVDMVGQEIRPGDYIFYSISLGSSPSLVLGKVIRFVTEDPQGVPYRGHRWGATDDSPYYYKIHVQPLIRPGWWRSDQKLRKVYLGDNSCVVKADVTRASLPDEDDES